MWITSNSEVTMDYLSRRVAWFPDILECRRQGGISPTRRMWPLSPKALIEAWFCNEAKKCANDTAYKYRTYIHTVLTNVRSEILTKPDLLIVGTMDGNFFWYQFEHRTHALRGYGTGYFMANLGNGKDPFLNHRSSPPFPHWTSLGLAWTVVPFERCKPPLHLHNRTCHSNLYQAPRWMKWWNTSPYDNFSWNERLIIACTRILKAKFLT